jgi:hypothetical protein
LPLELIFFCGAVLAPPRKAKLQNQSLCPKKLAVWNRLLSVWKRMEAIGNDSKRIAEGWYDYFFCLNLNHKMKKRHADIFGLGGLNELCLILKDKSTNDKSVF